MKYFFKIFLIFISFLILTILTQIGGIVLLLSLWISKKWKTTLAFKSSLVFLLLYFISTFIIVPMIAPMFGREKTKHTSNIKPTNIITDLLNRNYVRPPLNKVLQKTSKALEGSGIELRYLDANFPFINKFPLLPHLSHNDGKKLDLSLIYETQKGKLSNEKKSNSGYGVFENPMPNEINQIKICKDKAYYQYDFPKYLTLGSKNDQLIYSNKFTKQVILAILKNNEIGKIFIEPHLKNRLNIQDSRIRYHGCRSVRHDDHIHIQLK